MVTLYRSTGQYSEGDPINGGYVYFSTVTGSVSANEYSTYFAPEVSEPPTKNPSLSISILIYLPVCIQLPNSIVHVNLSKGKLSSPSNLQVGFKCPGLDQNTNPSFVTLAYASSNESPNPTSKFHSSTSGVQISLVSPCKRRMSVTSCRYIQMIK